METAQSLKPASTSSGQNRMTLVECPRDAMQGWPRPIPTETKIDYLNQLLQAGFDVLDFGSFVSQKAIPQLADTAEVLAGLRLRGTATKLLAIVANLRGAETAAQHPEIDFIGFPFSISETFQQRNTNKSITESLAEVEAIQQLCVQRGKELVVYISMGFGNPYGDEYSPDIVTAWVKKLAAHGIRTFAISDTVGLATPEIIRRIFSALIPAFPDCTIGAHFHSLQATANEKLEAAWAAGCRRFDSALMGIGGCPMAKDELVGNIATEQIVAWCDEHRIQLSLNRPAFSESLRNAGVLFSAQH